MGVIKKATVINIMDHPTSIVHEDLELIKPGAYVKINHYQRQTKKHVRGHETLYYEYNMIDTPPLKIVSLYYCNGWRKFDISYEANNNDKVPDFIGVIIPNDDWDKVKYLLSNHSWAMYGTVMQQIMLAGGDGKYIAIASQFLYIVKDSLELFSRAGDIVNGPDWDHLKS